MVRIRLRRQGTNSRPYYRIVVADQQSARDGAFIEQIGTYNPKANPPAATINEESAVKWLKQGAQPSEAIALIFKRQGIMDKVKASA